MAGIYIHVPFCRTRCIYCDFFSTTRGDLRTEYVEALCHEIQLQQTFLKEKKVQTIYFGGGTPSQLTNDDFQRIFKSIYSLFDVAADAEVTLEVNPDDLTPEYASMLNELPFNRVSMGVQTFDDDMLRLLRRRHDARGAREAISRLRNTGFYNLSIDLIYGLPGETKEMWQRDLNEAIRLNVEHISAYHLTYEKGTAIERMRQNHQIQEVSEDDSAQFYVMLVTSLKKNGYEHYEISNFCRPGFYSRHNSSYWDGTPYLGLGPAAHSYDGKSKRRWNKASLEGYLEGISKASRIYEEEFLDEKTRYNERMMVGLRTAKGISLSRLKTDFGLQYYDYCRRMAEPYLQQGKLLCQGDILKLAPEGVFISDGIISDLFMV